MGKNKMKPLIIAVFASGEGTNLQSIIEHIEREELDASIAAVICDKKNAHALVRARRSGVPAFFVDPKAFASKEAFEEKIVSILRERGVELAVLAGYMRIVGSVLLNAFPNRIINLHPSLLPAFKGANAPQQAINAGVKETGTSVHLVNEQLDGGEVLAQEKVPVLEGDDANTLQERIKKTEHRLLPEVIQLIAEGKLLDIRK